MPPTNPAHGVIATRPDRHLERAEQHHRDRERAEESVRCRKCGPHVLHPSEVEVADDASVARRPKGQAED